jgi:NADH-quinone oxidoreductase subunit A
MGLGVWAQAADVAAQATATAVTTTAAGTAAGPVRTVAEAQSNWLVIFLFFQMVLGVAVSMMLIPLLFSPKAPNRIKSMPYESGMPPIGEAQQRYTVRYYLIAMLFVIFDIEAVFFYPWAVAFNAIGWFALIEMFLFIALLLVAYVYAWRKGALDWAS